MTYNPDIHHRRSIRLKGYDYSKAGLYFITICTQNRLHLFGEIQNGIMILNDAGKMVETVWNEIPTHYLHGKLHEYVVMPNHVHGIIEIVEMVWDGTTSCGTGAVGSGLVGANNYSPLRDTPIHDAPPRDIPQTGMPNGTSKTIGSMVRGFKIGVTKWFRENSDIYTVWQRNYYEHIIRDEISYQRISQYIINNPLHWKTDD